MIDSLIETLVVSAATEVDSDKMAEMENTLYRLIQTGILDL